MTNWPQRYKMMVLLVVALLLCYVDRVLISVAGIEMQRELGWSDSQKGLVFSIFFLGYLFMQLLGGILANRFGGGKTFVLAVFGWSLTTILTPPAAVTAFTLLIFVRFMLGFTEGAAYPAAYKLIYSRMLSTEVSRSVGMIAAASSIGTVLALFVVGIFIEWWGWPSVFYLFGSLGIIWCIFWQINGFSKISGSQVSAKRIGNKSDSTREVIPFRLMLTHRSVVPLYVVSIAFGCMSYTLASWLPSFFVDIFGLSLVQAGTYSILPWVTLGLATIWGGIFADRQINAGHDRLRVRKKIVNAGLILSVIGFLLLTISPSAVLTIVITSIIFSGLGFLIPGYLPIAGEILPRHGEILYGFLAASASLFSLAVVTMTGVLIDNTGSYDSIFLILAALGLLTVPIFTKLVSVEPLLPEDAAEEDTRV